MSRYKTAVLVIAIQCLLVLTVAGKFLVERKVCPRVWARAANVDPNSPMRGRYLILPLEVDACALPGDGDAVKVSMWSREPGGSSTRNDEPELGRPPARQTVYWSNFRLEDHGGKLTAVPTPAGAPRPGFLTITRNESSSCAQATLISAVDYYIPDTAQWPPTLGKGDALWVEVTVPPEGPPRPIQLAVSRGAAFTPLKID